MISSSPLVTIAIPTYNQRWCIAEAIESALAQDYLNLEVIISDDFSNEDIYDIVKQYEDDKRLRYYKNEKNLGRTGNYKKCLYEYATGEWYLNLDGDDILTDKYFISNAIGHILKSENIVLATAGCVRMINDVVDYTITSNYNKDVTVVNGKRFFNDLSTKKAWISHLTSLYDRKKALALDFYREDILSSDYESLFRLILTGDVLVFKSVAGFWRIHHSNESKGVLDNPRLIINNFRYIENVAVFSKNYIPASESKSWRSTALNDQILIASLQYLLKKPVNYVDFTVRMFIKYPIIMVKTQFKILHMAAKKLFNINTVRQ